MNKTRASRFPELSKLGGELSGGVTAAVIGLPKNIAYGLIALAPLGVAWQGQGVMAGFAAAIVGGGVAALLGGTPALISGPSAAAALVFAGTISQLAAVAPQFASEVAPESYQLLALVMGFLVMALAGLWQVVFGFLRLGNLIKFTPYPVIAGLLNGLALLVFFGELESLMRFSTQWPFVQLDVWRWLLALLVLAVSLWGKRVFGRFLPGVPSVLIALIVGSLAYYGLAYAGLEPALGGRLDSLGQTRLTPRYFGEMTGALALEGTLSIFPVLITAALSVAFLASTKTLLAALNVQNLSHQRSDVNRELMAQGLANIAAAGFGGIASEGSFSQSVGNYQAGGRTRLSGIAWSVVTLLAIFVLAPFFQLIPNAVISGLLLYIALTMTDRWSLGLLARVIGDKRQRKLFLTDALLIVLVTVVTLVTNLNIAVAVGVLASVVVFVVRMSKTTVHRRYDAASRHSKRQRDERALAVLTEHGGNIHVIELEGSLFFASADALALELDTLAGLGVHAVILDLKRLRDIDLSSVRVLKQTYARLREGGCQLALSYVQPDTLVQRTLVTGGLFESLPLGACFADTDSALERFEDHLLASRAPQMSSRVELELPDVPVLAGLSADDLAVLKAKFYREHYRQGERIVCQGDPGDAMYIITRGLADVILDLPGGRSKRLSSLAAGTFFGELALLDRSARSANIDASLYLVCYRLDVHDFERLQRTHPDISMKLLANISRTLTTRLRYANETIVELEL